MRKFYIVKNVNDKYFLRVVDPLHPIDQDYQYRIHSMHLCWLNPNIFKLPYLEEGNHIQVKELPLKRRAKLTRPYSCFYITVGKNESSHCSRTFMKHTHKQYHIETSTTKSVSVIKLKLS